MRYILTPLIALICSVTASAQNTVGLAEVLTSKQVAELFPGSVRKTLTITFPIFRVFKYADKTGQYYCILTENRNEINSGGDTLNSKIKALNVKAEKGSLIKIWEINDHIIENKDESSIWFWTRYIEFNDYDNDGVADPVMIYGTSAANGFDDGRIKLIIYYKGKKIAIRHQNDVSDVKRQTLVDKAFYDLPQALQEGIKQKMELITNNNQAIFPAGWQTAMKNKMTIWKER